MSGTGQGGLHTLIRTQQILQMSIWELCRKVPSPTFIQVGCGGIKTGMLITSFYVDYCDLKRCVILQTNFIQILFAHHLMQNEKGRIEIWEVINSWINPKGPKENSQGFSNIQP